MLGYRQAGQEKASGAGGEESRGLPLTAVDGACRLALGVNAFSRRAHLQLSARGGGGV